VIDFPKDKIAREKIISNKITKENYMFLDLEMENGHFWFKLMEGESEYESNGWFDCGELEIMQNIKYRSFSFGRKKGQNVCSVCHKSKDYDDPLQGQS
jgi:hypothetical protein